MTVLQSDEKSIRVTMHDLVLNVCILITNKLTNNIDWMCSRKFYAKKTEQQHETNYHQNLIL